MFVHWIIVLEPKKEHRFRFVNFIDVNWIPINRMKLQKFFIIAKFINTFVSLSGISWNMGQTHVTVKFFYLSIFFNSIVSKYFNIHSNQLILVKRKWNDPQFGVGISFYHATQTAVVSLKKVDMSFCAGEMLENISCMINYIGFMQFLWNYMNPDHTTYESLFIFRLFVTWKSTEWVLEVAFWVNFDIK